MLFTNVQNKNIYTYVKVQQGETEFPNKNCPPKRKDKTIKNRKLIHNYTSCDTNKKKKLLRY